MEGIALLGLAGVGYLLNKNKNSSKQIDTTVQPPVFQNTNNSIYDLNNVADAQTYETQLVNQRFNQTLNTPTTMVSDFNAKGLGLGEQYTHNNEVIIGLDGNPIKKDEFLVNDQGIKVEPFFSGEGPPPVDLSRNNNLERANGMTSFRYINQEARGNGVSYEALHGPMQPYGNPFGMSDTGPAMEQDRYIPGMYRTDERPFEQERVPHIDQNSEINRDIGEIYAQRNSVDNIRALSNQKESFGGRVVAGKGIEERGKEGQVFKHLPEQAYEQSSDRWLVTNGAFDAPKIRPAEILPETNRQYLNRQEVGPAGPNGYFAEEKRPMFKKTDRQQLASDTVRNAYGTEIFIDSDHMQSSYKVYANEREVTEERTYDGNLQSVVPGETRHLLDNVKTTVKETTINAQNPNGFTNTVTTAPEERLQDAVKTSKKETVLFEYVGGGRGSTLQEMAQDQYFRADLNPNKEVIAQGRAPTTESVKLANGMDTINMDIKKIEDDYFNHRINGVTHVFQKIPTDTPCEYTRDKDTLDNDKLAYRIEGDLLDPFKHNPYTHSLHSFTY